ncbi:MAG: LysE family transporter [Bacteroidales bacterium]
MIESIITMSVAGLLSGFIFSMPIAGPISILITSNALKGRLRYCYLVNLGASFADFTYVFIAVYGLTKLYSFYKPIIPYLFSFGSVLLIFLGYKIFRTKVDIEHLEDKSHISEKIKKKEKGAIYTGFMINLFNPTLFIGWLTSSLLVITILAAMGFHTGGLAVKIDQNAKEISSIEGRKIENSQNIHLQQLGNMQLPRIKNHKEEPTVFPPHFHLIISICYAFFISVGSIIWFYLLAFLIVHFRKRINIKIISVFIKGLGIILCSIGLYFGFHAVQMFINLRMG